MKRVIQFMGQTSNTAYSVDEEVVKQLYERAKASMKNGEKNASAYVNKLLKFALENYKEPANEPQPAST